MTAYYNEIDPFAAQWLRELIKAGHIAPGFVDERSIEDVKPNELMGYTQCHFFAGIGVWSYALRQAGFPDSARVWTGSCPCQPFSAAGKGNGFDDERHLWPAFQWLIQQCQPPIIFGEQVASKSAGPWIDLVQADVEALGYAFGCVAFPAASVGAPHIRDRLYWVAHANGGEQQGQPVIRGLECHRENAGRSQGVGKPESHGDICGMGHADGDAGRGQSRWLSGAQGASSSARGEVGRIHNRHSNTGEARRPGPVNGFWNSADWLHCRDGKFRPVEPGTFPLANGAAARVGRLRGYGNAIVAQQAEAFIKAVMEATT